MTSARIAVLVALSGCGRVGFGATADTVDAGAADADVSFQFSAPERVVGLADVDDSVDDATLAPGGTELLFNRDQPQNDVYRAVRDAPGAPWTMVAVVPELSSGGVDATPKLSADGLTVVIGSTRQSSFDLYVSVRASLETEWSTPVAIDELNTTDDEFSAMLSDDGLELLFSRRDVQTLITTVIRARRSSLAAPWQEVETLDFGVESATDAFWLDDDDTLLVSVRTARGDNDLVVARREGAAFVIVDPLAAINSDASETDPWLTASGELFFTSGRSGSPRIYRSLRD